MKPKTYSPSDIRWRKLPSHSFYTGFVGIPIERNGYAEDEIRFYCYDVEGKGFVPSEHFYQPGICPFGDWVELDGPLLPTIDEAKAYCLAKWKTLLLGRGEPAEVMTLQEFEVKYPLCK